MVKIKDFIEIIKTEYEDLKETILTTDEYPIYEGLILLGYINYILEMIKQNKENKELQNEMILREVRAVEFKLYKVRA